MSDDYVAATVRPVVLCGGSGSRLWPLSRSLHPKQLLDLAGGGTLLQATVQRVQNAAFSSPIIVTGEEHRFMVREQLAAISVDPVTIILEPEGRNTAPAIALSMYWQVQEDPEQLLLVMPSDHVIHDTDAFLAAVEAGLPAARAGRIVTFGIRPEHAEVGYGYIEANGETTNDSVRPVERFVEKPDIATAKRFVASGNHFWNGGIFLFKASVAVEELRQFAPSIASACCAAMSNATIDGPFCRPEAEAFRASPSISIDYAVMEKTHLASVIPVEMNWSDVGSWDALWEVSPKDERGNVVKGDVFALDSTNSIIRSETDVTIAALGLEDMVVVATRDAILVVPRNRSQDTKLLVQELKSAGVDKQTVHTQVHRPWGSYEVIDSGARFQTKRLTVKPGERLSLQLHHHRSEHWVVVAGTAKITVGEEVSLLQENESTYVPAGTVHRLENPGKTLLHLIEVQCGSYLGEDDIVRLEDGYGRIADVA